MFSHSLPDLSIQSLIVSLYLQRGHQEDAEEFLGFFLDTLHEEFLSAIKRSAHRLSATSNSNINGVEAKPNGVNGSSAAEVGDNDDDRLSETEKEREVERPRSPVEEDDEWLEVGQKGKTNFTRTVSVINSLSNCSISFEGSLPTISHLFALCTYFLPLFRHQPHPLPSPTSSEESSDLCFKFQGRKAQ